VTVCRHFSSQICHPRHVVGTHHRIGLHMCFSIWFCHQNDEILKTKMATVVITNGRSSAIWQVTVAFSMERVKTVRKKTSCRYIYSKVCFNPHKTRSRHLCPQITWGATAVSIAYLSVCYISLLTVQGTMCNSGLVPANNNPRLTENNMWCLGIAMVACIFTCTA
jgi:isopentenyldiphosphate isomerase